MHLRHPSEYCSPLEHADCMDAVYGANREMRTRNVIEMCLLSLYICRARRTTLDAIADQFRVTCADQNRRCVEHWLWMWIVECVVDILRFCVDCTRCSFLLYGVLNSTPCFYCAIFILTAFWRLRLSARKMHLSILIWLKLNINLICFTI